LNIKGFGFRPYMNISNAKIIPKGIYGGDKISPKGITHPVSRMGI